METTPPEQHPHAYARLSALKANLDARGYTCTLDAGTLTVIAPVDHGPRLADEIVAKPRQVDDGVLWFFTRWGRPIARADEIVDAAVEIVGLLRPRTVTPAPRPV